MRLKLFHKIAFALAALSVSASILVSLITYFKYKQTLKGDAYSMLQSLVESHGLALENQIEAIENYSLVLEAIVRQSYAVQKFENDSSINKYEQSLIPLLDTLAQKFKPLSYWIIFNPEYAKNGHTISFLDKDRDGIYIREAEYSINEFDLSKPDMLWWVDALKYGEVWTDPYYWQNWDMNIITFSKRIVINGKILGVLGSDIDFIKFKQSFVTRKIYKTGYLWIINHEYEPISFPDSNKIFRDEIAGLIKHKLEKSKQSDLKTGIIEDINDENRGIITYYRLKNGWFLCAQAPKNEIFSDLNNTMLINILVILGGIILSLGASVLISRSLTKPISQMVDLIKKGANGDYTVRVKIGSHDELKELSSYFNYFMDELEKTIYHLKINQVKLISAKERAEESDKLKSAFLANLSHEIRTPMNAIIGFTSLMLEDDLDKNTVQKYIDIVHLSTYDLLDILNNLIDYSILESKLIKIENEKFELNELLDSINFQYTEDLKNCNKNHIELSLVKENESKEIFVFGDKASMQQVFSNLISNSIKFTDRGFVRFGYHLVNNEFLFFVEDSGLGIAEGDLSKVFNSFYKGINTSHLHLRGTGLGLTITKKLVKKMGGKIWIDSISGKGTKVTFKLPVQIK